ncbi:MAG: putative GntR-family transcriptional regulator [Rhizobacter sp.]|nr:putative GntR-family transcriptional regulator [Rhizobacter sp.]
MPTGEPAYGTGTDGLVGHQVRVPKMAELVASDLRRQVATGELSEGDSLPSEAVLMHQFGVSRPTLREAFRILEAESLIVVRRGAGGGGRVQPPSEEVAARYAALVLEHRRTAVQDVWDARVLLEPPAAGLLARRRTDDDIAQLRRALAEHDELEHPADLVRAHNDFHALVMTLAGNDTLALFNAMLADIIERSSWHQVSSDLGSTTHERIERGTLRSHHDLVDHIVARDADAAEDLWRRHLRAGAAYLQRGGVGAIIVDLQG